MKRLFFYNILFITNIAIAQSGLNGSVGNHGESYSGQGIISKSKYYLTGRKLINNPFKDSISESYGKIILDILVDKNGKVIEVSGPSRGSTSSDSVLFKKAKVAALKAQFNKVDSTYIQKGRITFRYFVKS